MQRRDSIFVGGGRLAATSVVDDIVLTDHQIASIQSKKVFFGHQSVGADLIQGIRELMAEDPRLKLAIVSSDNPGSVPGPAFVESVIGENENPRSKDDAFGDALARGMGAQGGIAMYKYCYVDIGASTDVQQLFESYRNHIRTLKLKYPSLKLVHITLPLTTAERGPKVWVKTVLGRTTTLDSNAKRNEFNSLLKQTYAATDPIFDLAEAESTRPDGSRTFFMRDNKEIYTLAPEFTADGGHLNKAGRRAAALRLLLVLASGSPTP